MKIAILSGKGGTGKTLIAVNLAAAAGAAVYLDCDVEEPNGHLFFKPVDVTGEPVTVKIPVVDSGLCTGCRLCVDFCKFNALALIKNNLIVFEEICHSCGGCVLLCPERALSEKDKIIGRVEIGRSGGVRVCTGIMNAGESSGVPIIKRLLDTSRGESCLPHFIDCPPGSACTVMESIMDADYCILAAEPTVFGVHNLNMVYELVRLFNKPFGVVLNKCRPGENPAERFCEEKGIKIIGRIDFDRELGRLNSAGGIAARENKRYRELFEGLLGRVEGGLRDEATADS